MGSLVDASRFVRPAPCNSPGVECEFRRRKRKVGSGEEITEEKEFAVVRQMGAGRTGANMAREIGVSTSKIYSWKATYGGMEPSEAPRLHHLKDENSRLKLLVADLSVDRKC